MENSKYKEIIENGDVYKEQLAIVHIPGTLHSDDANHVVTTSDEVYDIEIGKRQSEINKIQEGVVIEIAKIFNDINTLVSKQILINESIENLISSQKDLETKQGSFTKKQNEFINEQKVINNTVLELNKKQITVESDISFLKSLCDVLNTEINSIKNDFSKNNNTEDYSEELIKITSLEEAQKSLVSKQHILNENVNKLISDFNLFKQNQILLDEAQSIRIENVEKNLNDFKNEQRVFNKNQINVNDNQRAFNINVDTILEQHSILLELQKKTNADTQSFITQQRVINEDVRNDINSIKLDFISAGGDINAIKQALKDYVTKDEYTYEIGKINRDISNLDVNIHTYVDTEISKLNKNIDSKIDNIDLSEYYTKEEVNDLVENVEVDLTEYYTKKEVDTALENVEVDLTEYYTKEQIDSKFLALEIEDMLKKVSTSMSISPGGSFETGNEVNVTVTYHVNGFALSDKSQLSLNITKNGNVVASGTGETLTYKDKISKSTSYYGNCSYKNGVKTWSSSTYKNSYHKTYYGFGLNENDVFTNGNSQITNSASGTYSDFATVDGVYYYIIVPNGVYCPSTFTMYATPFVMEVSNITKNNISYTILKSGSVFGIGGEVNINAQ